MDFFQHFPLIEKAITIRHSNMFENSNEFSFDADSFGGK
jgi:hypothetical protein